jgi:predicted RNA binding protein YcfA (HicA-like mRNA interferase family)
VGNENLPVGPARRHLAAFRKLGWTEARRKNGSHIILRKPGQRHTLSLPDHREVKRALLGKLLKTAGITEDDYLEAYED